MTSKNHPAELKDPTQRSWMWIWKTPRKGLPYNNRLKQGVSISYGTAGGSTHEAFEIQGILWVVDVVEERL